MVPQPNHVRCGTQEDEKHKTTASRKFNHECIMPPPLFTEQWRHVFAVQ